MIEDIRDLLNQYVTWLRDKTTLRQINDWIEITTPYLDRHNDYLQIYATRKNGAFLLSDDGYVIDDLKQSGCKLDSSKRQALLKMTLNGFGVQLNEGRLEVKASRDNFPLKKHNLIQAMLSVNDLFHLAVPIVTSLFFEDVVEWLDLQEIRYTPKVKFTGKSGYDHVFDFVIPKSRKYPERIVHTINRPNRDTAESLAWAWVETKEVRSPETMAYAFLNDTEQNIANNVLDALQNYDVKPVLWTRREDVRIELAA
ncbi:MAG TPA: DUF1829 domain-containing protein [Smithellaceae bacterium]|nr:DUF1829 domain-containing protein [Smithellaceae bacterium]